MNSFTQNLGLRLIISSIFLAFATIFVAGYFVYKQSQVAINNNALVMVKELSITLAQPDASSRLEDYMRRYIASKSGSVWLMDNEGHILASTYPRFGEPVPGDTSFSNTVFRLKFARKLERFTDTKRTDVHLVTPKDIISKYEEGIAEYDYMGTTRTVAFKVIPENGWLLGIDKPVGVAYSELENIKKYIVIVCIISVIMISFFSWLAIRKIIQPYYKDVEDLNARLADSVKKLSTLHKVSRSIQQILPLEDMLSETITCIAEALGYDRVMLHLIDEQSGGARLKMALVDGELSTPESMPKEVRTLKINKENGVLERVIVEQRPYVIHNALKNDMVDKNRVRALGVREFAAVPLIVETKCIGVITVDNPSSRKPIREEDIDTLMTFADRVGLAIKSAQLHTELQNYVTDLATTDSLTGLYNQSHFSEWLEKEAARSRRENKPLSIVLVQAYCLKEINEKFGYVAGNIALKRLGEIIASSMRGEDEIGARLGGGEFVIGLCSSSEERVREVADEVKKRVEAFRFDEEGLERVDLRVNVSFSGLKTNETAQDLLERIRRMSVSDPD